MTNVRLQNLRDFTVQIRNDADQIVGTGIAVSMDGRIVTCRHVVESALRHKNIEGAEVGVYFQFAAASEKKDYRAVVEKFFPQNDDDIVLMQLKGGKSPLAPEQLPKLGDARDSAGNPFKSFGYRSLSNYQGLPANGEIVDYAAKPEDLRLLCDPVMLDSKHIDHGMSGAAVLDAERNLVVGIIAQTNESAGRAKDRDTSFAVDNQVLTFSPFDFKLEDMPLPLKAAPFPKFDIAQAEAAVFIKDKYSWNSAPSVLTEWTGRDDLLAQITEDWNNPQKHVTGLIGFGGEGKSSLARKWVETIIESKVEGQKSSDLQPSTFDGLFWWGFYENRSIDEFLEAALNFLSGGKIDPRQVPSSSLRAQIIGAMLGAGRYLFVLDGLEVLQHQEGDQYGLLQSNDLRDLLTYFARPDNQSFCLITSRAPVLDLMEYTTYTHRDVNRLSEADGVALLQKLGVKPSPAFGRGQGEGGLAKVVSDWDGHALTISLLGSYLAEKYNGDIAHLADIPIPTADEPRYERVHRVLRRYDEHLSKDEREFLKLFSAFRTPVHESAFEKVFVPLLSKTDSSNNASRISNIVSRLVAYRILHCDTTSQTYTAHPLVRNHYLAHLTHDTGAPEAHLKIKDYYLSIAGDTPQYPTLDDLKPLIEVVHHACQAGAYDEATDIYFERISQQNRFVILHQLGAYDTALSILLNFFPTGDFESEPQVSKPRDKGLIYATAGLSLTCLGRMREAIPVYEKGNAIDLSQNDWTNASINYQNLADLHAQLCALEKSAEAARQALDLARKAENKQSEMVSLSWQGWANSLIGNLNLANEDFGKAEPLAMEVGKNRYLWSNIGIFHANYLHRTGDLDYARRVTEANIKLSEQGHWIDKISLCHRVLGDLDFDSGNHESARTHYESALKIARSISVRHVLIEALLARGRFYAKVAVGAGSPRPNDARPGSGDPTPTITDAFTDLNEALNYAVEGGYRIYEADIRVALAWAYFANGEKEKAKQSAQRALQMSQEMGYHWGKVDGEEVMQRMKEEG